jgi:glucosamine--fructose-6-phosphate aminotransferase (isomerizing)
MCGIIGCLGSKNTVSLLVEGLKRLEYRGYDSAGIAVLKDGKIERRRVKGKIRLLEDHLRENPLEGAYGIAHTRWATHGRPSEENAHPHVDCTGTLAIVHNGIIENHWALKEKLKKAGHVFRTETDTEVLVHLIEGHFSGVLEEAVRAAVREAEGSYAIACISSGDPEKIVVARNGPPVVVGIGPEEFYISSDINPLLEHTKNVAFLEDGEIAVLRPAGVEYFNSSGEPLEKEVETLSWTPSMIEKRGYDHFMAKEIFEQPEVVRDTVKGRLSFDTGRVFLDDAGITEDVMKGLSKVVLLACGTSYHAGLLAKYWLESLARVPVEIEYASEFRSRDFVLDAETLVMAISQSGETADTLAALRLAQGRSRAVLAVTNSLNSSMAREADGVLFTHAGPEIGVAATKTFVAQMTALMLFSMAVGQANGVLGPEESLSLTRGLQRIPHQMEKVLGRSSALEDLARAYLSCEHYLFLGRWISFPIALEGALKLKEISYTHAEGYAAGEMKHGPIALIDEGMTTLAVIPRDRVYEKIVSNVEEVRARGGRILAVSFEGDEKAPHVANEILSVPETHPLLSPFLTILPLQLFAYYSASAKGFDVDQPRNLAKSVTVE